VTLNLAQRSFKVLHFGRNRKSVSYFIQAVYSKLVTLALSSNVSEILAVLYARANCVSKYVHERMNTKA